MKRTYAIPPNLPIEHCPCGARVVKVESESGRTRPLEYHGGAFPQRGPIHSCSHCQKTNPTKPLPAPPLRRNPTARPEMSRSGTPRPGTPPLCRACRVPIRFSRTVEGELIPLNLDGTPHWANCTHPEHFRRLQPTAPTKARRKKSTSNHEQPAFELLENY